MKRPSALWLVALPKVCELQSHNGLSVTLYTGTFQMIWLNTPQNELGNPKWFPELFLVTIMADGRGTSPELSSMWDPVEISHLLAAQHVCLSQFLSFPSPSPILLSIRVGVWTVTEVSRKRSVDFWGQAKGLIEKFSVLKHGFFPGSIKLNAHWSLLFVCLFVSL